jgi:hypothetical protein
MDPRIRIRTKMSARLPYVVPVPDGEGDHGELSEDEGCEADGTVPDGEGDHGELSEDEGCEADGTVPDGEGDHGELSEDESCEADGHHMDELLLEEQQRPEHDDGALVVSPVLRIRDVVSLFSIPDPGSEFFHPGSSSKNLSTVF